MKGFGELPTYRKAEIVFKKTNYLDRINYNNQTIMLNRLDTTLFEVSYNQSEDKIFEILLADKNRLHWYGLTLNKLKLGHIITKKL